MSFSDRLIACRSQCGMTQYALAKVMEVSRQAVSKWETGQSMPSSQKLIQLAEILDTDVEYLTSGRLPEKPLPIVVSTVQTVEKVVEKPVIQIVEAVAEKPIVEYVDKAIVKVMYRNRYLRNPLEFLACGGISLLIGILIGLLF